MRTRTLLIVALVALAAPPVQANNAAVQITELLADPAQGEREFIELHNTGAAAVDLSGWTIEDAAGNTFTFGNQTLAAGGRIVVWGGGTSDARGPAWSRATVWNNGGDSAQLRDGGGTLIDVLAYGAATWPDGRNASVPAAAPNGESLAKINGRWVTTAPTPAAAPTAQAGTVSATVEDRPPAIRFIDPPTQVAPGETLGIRFNVTDPNGDPIGSWSVWANGALVATGSTDGANTVTLTAPSDADVWRLRIDASDPGGNTTQAFHNATVQGDGLVVILPPGGLAFPAMGPGDQGVETLANFTLRNDGAAVAPRIDISDLAGPAVIPVLGNLQIGITHNATTTWITYANHLQSLDVLAPGQAWSVSLRINQVPTPLPAGTYGTSFTVVG